MTAHVTTLALLAAPLVAAMSILPIADIARLSPGPNPRGLAGAFAGVHSGHLIAAGGANFPDGVMPWDGGTKAWHDRAFALAPDAEATWRPVGRLPAPNAYGVSLTVPDGVLIIGGGNATRHYADVSRMTLNGDAVGFRALPSLPVPLAQMTGAMVGRAVHVVGGIARPEAVMASAGHYRLELDAIDKGWVEMARLPSVARILAVGAGDAQAFYVMGGCALAPDGQGKPVRTYLRDAWRFAAGRWTRLADMPAPLAASASPAPMFGQHVYVVSGDDGRQAGVASPAQHKGFAPQVLRYDTAVDAWYHAGHLQVPAPVTLPSAPWKDGFALFNGEVRPGVRTSQVLLFRDTAMRSGQ